MQPHDALKHYFDFPAFRPGQESALTHILAQRDTLVVMPTGSGKSLIYQLAALLLPGTALVISPLVSLMKDQIDRLARRNIAATFINSSLDAAESARRLRQLAEGRYKIVLVAPERLRSRDFRDALARNSLSLLAVDEAHCVSQWGHDFRPDYLHIGDIRTQFNIPLTLALTATATLRVQDDIIRLLGLAQAERIITGFNRPNLSLEVFSTPDVAAKLNFIRSFLDSAEGAGIIYTGTRRDAEEVAGFVEEVMRIPARYYHGTLESETRAEVQDAFMAGDLPIVVATNAFGMGIDRPDVRFVLHYSMPGAIEAYYQEAGRAGRDGLPARAMLLYSPKDTALHEFFIANDSPSADDLHAVHRFLQRFNTTFSEDIERATGLPATRVRIALEKLEVAGAIQRETEATLGQVSVETSPLSEAALRDIAAQVTIHQQHKREQLARMVDYAETDRCRRRAILDHFGDASAAEASVCCDNCLMRSEPQTQPGSPQPIASLSQSERAALIVLSIIARLKTPLGASKLARLLKGSSAQNVRRYSETPNFGKLAALRIADIEELIIQLISAGHIKQIGSDRPTLKLTPRGESALKNRSAIQVQLRQVQPANMARLKAEREAGGTLALTKQMLERGLSPEQIAAERGLNISTIYSHLAQLIAEKRIAIDAVVPAETQHIIRAAIAKIGSVDYLAPIKALLPDAIDYSSIRCVANAWLIEHNMPLPARAKKPAPAPSVEDPQLFEQLRKWRREKARAQKKPPYTIFSDATLHALATLRPQSLKDLFTIHGIGATRAEQYGADVLALIARSTTTPDHQSTSSPEHPDPIADFLSRAHPRPLKGPWLAGWALDFHSRYDGSQASRTRVGELAFRYKYNGERQLAADLVACWIELLAAHPELPRPDALLPIPSSTARDFDPVLLLAQTLAKQLDVPLLADALVKTRATRQQKEMTSLAQKRANVADVFALKSDVRAKHLLLLDDLYDSGMTLENAARVIMRNGVASLVVLTLTKTIHADT